jgi:hypothetical protein
MKPIFPKKVLNGINEDSCNQFVHYAVMSFNDGASTTKLPMKIHWGHSTCTWCHLFLYSTCVWWSVVMVRNLQIRSSMKIHSGGLDLSKYHLSLDFMPHLGRRTQCKKISGLGVLTHQQIEVRVFFV